MPDINTVSVADATKWNDEFITDYAINEAILPKLCWQQGWMPGNGTVTFDIVQDDAEATTRDRNGNIVYGLSNQATVSVSLEEALGAEKITNFDAFKSSVDQRKIMYIRTAGAINRDLNSKVITQLDGGSNSYNSGTPVQATKAHVKKLIQQFWESTRGADGEAFAVITIGMFLQVTDIAQVSSRDYVDDLPLVKGLRPFRWENITWVPFDDLPGRTTTDATCFLFHRRAVAFKSAGAMNMIVDFNKEHRYFYCNAQEMCAAKRLLNKGVFEFHHNDTAAYS